MFSPPRMIMSLMRPVTRKYPSSSTVPMSPECKKPFASMALAVSSGIL